MATVTVIGTARASVRPDRAVLDLGLTHVALSSSEAMDRVAEQSNELADHLDELGFDEREWSTQGVTLSEEWEWKNDTNTKVGYRATTGVTVNIVELDLVNQVLSVAVDDAGAQVRSLRWLVAPDNPAREALLGAAAIDARHRALAYSSALNLSLGQVEDISDLPVGSKRQVGQRRAGAADGQDGRRRQPDAGQPR